MLSLFAKSPTWDEINNQERLFEVWLLVEALVIMCTVCVNVLYVFLRAFFRGSIDIDTEYYADENR